MTKFWNGGVLVLVYWSLCCWNCHEISPLRI